jgi:GTPase involved in cell partitioning and DNA repair
MLTVLIFLFPPLLHAEGTLEIDMDNFLTAKKALVKETLQLTEKESTVFWALYDAYVKAQIKIFNRHTALIREHKKKSENLSDKEAEVLINKYLELQADDLKLKQAYVKKFSKKLPYRRVYQFFDLEDRIEAGFFAVVAEELPLIEE